MKCPICKFENDAQALYCSSCGYDLDIAQAERRNAGFSPTTQGSLGSFGSEQQGFGEQNTDPSVYHIPSGSNNYPSDNSWTPQPADPRRNTLALIGFILSLVSIPSCCCAVLPQVVLSLAAMLLPVGALVCSSMGLKSEKKAFAVAGVVVSLLSLIINIIFLLIPDKPDFVLPVGMIWMIWSLL